MNELQDLYQEVILDHYKRPRNFGPLDDANHQASGHNPLCGDKVKVFARIEDGVLSSVSFEGAGCAISTASASLMTEAIEGKSVAEARRLFERFHALLTSDGDRPTDDLDKLEALSGVREFPMRVKCATLAWHTLQAALEQDAAEGPVSTE